MSVVAIRQSVGTKCSQCTSINTQSAELRFLNTVDWEIFTINKFSLVASVAKIKRVKTKYTYTHYIVKPSGERENLKRKLFLPQKLPNLWYAESAQIICVKNHTQYQCMTSAWYTLDGTTSLYCVHVVAVPITWSPQYS